MAVLSASHTLTPTSRSASTSLTLPAAAASRSSAPAPEEMPGLGAGMISTSPRAIAAAEYSRLPLPSRIATLRKASGGLMKRALPPSS